MKSVLMAIQPKWCELIANGKKTIEVRKTAPKLNTPFKCYIYCTQGTFDITLCQDLNTKSVKKVSEGRGKVIGEFVCDSIEAWNECERLEMERLTKRDTDGTAIAPEFADKTYIMQDDHDRFTGYISSPIIDRLAELEDKLESGQLVELPFKLGDEVFVVEDFGCGCLRVETHTISGFEFGKRDNKTIFALDEYRNHYAKVFYLKEEAEARLKELQEGENG